MAARARTMAGTNDGEGEGERWRALQSHAIRERRIKENTQSERASAKWAAVASQASETRRRGGNWPRLPGAMIYSRCNKYETSTLRNDGWSKRIKRKYERGERVETSYIQHSPSRPAMRFPTSPTDESFEGGASQMGVVCVGRCG
jgi:hypothetical protein